MLFHVALKNITGNIKGSLSYIVSMIICVLIYFSLASLEFNTAIQGVMSSDIKTKALFKIGLIMTAMPQVSAVEIYLSRMDVLLMR